MTFARQQKTGPVLDVLRTHRDLLIDEGILHLDVFGSAARGDAAPHDIDICVELREEMRPRGFARIGQINALRRRLHQLLG